jgi:hypothetical protein
MQVEVLRTLAMKRDTVMDCSDTKNNSKNLYHEAYKAHDNGDRGRLLETCRLLTTTVIEADYWKHVDFFSLLFLTLRKLDGQ